MSLKNVLFYFMCMVFCLYVCGPLACLVPFDARGRLLNLELQIVVSPPVGAGHQTQVL